MMEGMPAVHRLFRSALCAALLCSTAAAAPIALHPENPHYFLYRGKPAVLITSAEHYGAVVNLEFDYRKYLDTMAADGLNLTRVFTGTYIEPQGAFNIAQNTLAPKPGQFIAPWARNAEGKFDLATFNDAWFVRMKDFVSEAGKRGIVVELTLFCPMYEEPQWLLSPMNARNNVNGAGAVGPHDVHTLDKSGGLLPFQEALVRKITVELQSAENLMYEICNEPYFGGVTMAWQHRIADVITESEKTLPHRHLITQNIANGSSKIDKPHPQVSVFNFHYCHPPDAVGLNWTLNKAIGDNETGFKGTADAPYREEAWAFILAGGALFNHLDYSFTAAHEDGSFSYPPSQPGGGNAGFRRQMKRLKDFIHEFDFVKMSPASAPEGARFPDKSQFRMLAEPGRQYAAWLKGAAGFPLPLDLPAGTYTAQWLHPVSGETRKPDNVSHAGGKIEFRVPDGWEECALKVVRTAP